MKPSRGRPAQRERTRRSLLEAAVRLMAKGQAPTITEVADTAGVSRRTAYRYFPAQEQLLVEASLEGLQPAMEAAIRSVRSPPVPGSPPGDAVLAWVEARLDATVRAMYRLAAQYEPLLRTIRRLTAGGAGSAGTNPRGFRRLEWITAAIEPIRDQVGPERFARLACVLATCVGFDALFLLMDVRGLSLAEAEKVTRWMATTALRATAAEASEELDDGGVEDFSVA